MLILFLPLMALAQNANIFSVNVSTANPAPGSVLGVTVIYCQNALNNNTYFDIALEPSSATTMPGVCPVPGQILLVDGNNTPGPTDAGWGPCCNSFN